MTVKSRRAEYTEATRRALAESARRSFIERGYADTSIEDIVSAARVTRGAFYHHYTSKQAAFEDAFASVHESMMAKIGARIAGKDDLWDAAIAGLDSFLDVCLDPEYQRIALQEAPIALGWKRWRELDEQHAYGIVQGMVAALMQAGIVPQGPVEICARILFAAFAEAALAIDAAEDKMAARDHARALLIRLLEGLRV